MTTRKLSRRKLLTGTAEAAAVLSLLPAAAQAAESNLPPGVVPFRIDIPQARIDRIMARVRDVEWPDAPEDADPWAYGASLPVMKDLVAYWSTKYDWRAREARMNALLPQFKARIEDYDIHFVHVRGSGPNPQPIILTHGWPSTFIEFTKIIAPLTQPEKFGGRAEDAFSVVVPSLPGFGFSSKPKRPVGSRTTARLWDKLMTDVLGYKNYIAQGGDLGYPITREIGFESTTCKAVHMNHLLSIGAPGITDEEKAAEARRAVFSRDEGAYMHIQSTKPLTISYAMSDSPVGHAAWILEKWNAWADTKNNDIWAVFTRDEALDNIMLYVITNTYGTGAWFYATSRTEAPGPKRGKLEKPTGFAKYPAHDAKVTMMPRSYAERNHNVVWWSEPPAGGHYPADEVPQLFVDDIRGFNRRLRELGI